MSLIGKAVARSASPALGALPRADAEARAVRTGNDPALAVALVGAGPRGLSVLERLCANERVSGAGRCVVVHVIDPYRPGAGRVWRTTQSQHLLMNTVASQITVYTDDSVRIDGPIEAGPSLHDWASALALLSPAEARAAGHSGAALAEARRLGPDSYPTRAFYGHYLEHAYERIVAGAPERVTVVAHRTRAIGLYGDEGPQRLLLEDGTRLTGLHAVVLAQGHVDTGPAGQESELGASARRLGLHHIPPANPADVDLSVAEPGRPVLLRGLGLNFFDHMALLTQGRDGRYERVGGRLTYHPSGNEPRLYAGSRRGVPHHSRGENEKGAHGRYSPRLLTEETIAGLRKRVRNGEPPGFRSHVWPLISKEVESVYYGTLLAAAGRGEVRESFVRRYLDTGTAQARHGLLDAYAVPVADRWSWERIVRPYEGQRFAGPGDFRLWLVDHLRDDVAAARAGNVSGPLKAALDVLRDLRNEVRLIVDHGGLEGASHREELQGWYTPLNAFLSIGPPASRIEEMAALIEAGVLDVLGPGVRMAPDAGRGAFVAGSDVPGVEVYAQVLIEARLPETDLARTRDPLLRELLADGQCAPYRVSAAAGPLLETGGIAVTERPYRLVDARGRPHPRRFAYGIPTEGVHWVTAAGIRPGVDSVTLGDSDAIARAVLALPPLPGSGTESMGFETEFREATAP
ncbi:FAD/NAD(P)-binding protein [Streptomyces sp. NPDC021093]|uniref:FAD/NAD(P)-binding protein n=1 Tax=Streptomyces sp. NPDC021093 TaxID=3365112 RepID=UPI0037A1DDA9